MGERQGRWNDNSRNHHWWPRCLSKFWKGEDGEVRCIKPDGKIKTSKKRIKGFGSYLNWHKKTDQISDWWPKEKIEYLFQKADDDFPDVIEQLETLSTDKRVQHETNLQTGGKLIDADDYQKLYHCCASLIVRSPCFRNRISQGIEKYPWFQNSNHGLQETVVGNIERSFDKIESLIARSGKKFCFYAEENEFVFGDGFFNSATMSVTTISPSYFAGIIPLTPKIAFGFRTPSLGYSGFRLLTIGRTSVENINRLTMGYAKEHVFFRNGQPKIIDEYKVNEFKTLDEDKSIWFDEFCRSFGRNS